MVEMFLCGHPLYNKLVTPAPLLELQLFPLYGTLTKRVLIKCSRNELT